MSLENDETIIITDSAGGYRVEQASGKSKTIRVMTEEEYSSYLAKKAGQEIGRTIGRYLFTVIFIYPLYKAFNEKHPVWRKWVLFLICLCFGYTGVHRFILKKTKSGVIELITVGGLSIWWIIDTFRILFGNFPDTDGVKLQDKIKQYRKIKKELKAKAN